MIMNNYLKKEKKLKVYEYENGIILPQKDTTDGSLWGLGGVCDKGNNFADISFYDGGWAKHGGAYQWDEEEYVDEEIVYVGMFYLHWGHFLIDLTGRMWYLRELSKQGKKFKVGYLGEEEPKCNNLLFFKLLGIEEDQLYHIKKPTRFKKVLVPEQSFKSCEWYTDEFVKMFDEMYESVMNSEYDFSKVKDLKKIYFTRRSFSKAVGSEFGEEFFEELFNFNGYVSVAPETLSLEEQIYVWNNADEIVCINGTIPINVVFSKNQNLKLTVLNKTSIFHENPYILLKMRNISAEFVDIYKEPFKKYPRSLGEGPFLLDYTDVFKSYCESKGFIQIYSEKQIKKFFKKKQVKYFFAILALGRRLKNAIRLVIPTKLIRLIRS